MEIKSSPIGHEFGRIDLKSQCKAIYGGVAWPGNRPGFAVVLGMSHGKHFDNYDIYLLDEFESVDVRELVRQCGALNYRYKPKMWVGDSKNDAADRFIREMNSEFISSEKTQKQRPFCVCPTQILDMKRPYQYILAELKQLLDEERRQLFLKDSKVLGCLGGIEPQEIPAIDLGDFPAIEALAFAVIELRLFGQRSDLDMDYEEDTSRATSYTVKSVL